MAKMGRNASALNIILDQLTMPRHESKSESEEEDAEI